VTAPGNLRIFGIDPAKPVAKRGYALAINADYLGHGAAAQMVARDLGRVHWAVCEDQWLVPQTAAERARRKDPKAKVGGADSIMTLRLYAGILLGQWAERLGARMAIVPPAVWKGALFGAGFACTEKRVFTNNLRQHIVRRGFAVPESDDDVDACGLVLAAASGKFRLEDYEVR
jgi:hypothetical protein